MRQKESFKSGLIYHIFNKSIANYGIFKDVENSQRFIQALGYYNNLEVKINLGKFLVNNQKFAPCLLLPQENTVVKYISFCIMPDHYHLLVKIQKNNRFSKYTGDFENSFSRYFNLKFKRKGPIWQGRFKAVRIKTNEQLLHVSRYIHINPTTNNLVEKPEDWFLSSYRLIINDENYLKKIITEISISNPAQYKKFIEDRIDYQKTLKAIRKQILE